MNHQQWKPSLIDAKLFFSLDLGEIKVDQLAGPEALLQPGIIIKTSNLKIKEGI